VLVLPLLRGGGLPLLRGGGLMLLRGMMLLLLGMLGMLAEADAQLGPGAVDVPAPERLSGLVVVAIVE